jgi:hypothetical protein
MPYFNQLSPLRSISLSDQLLIYSTNNGDPRRSSVNELLEFFQSTFAAPTMATNVLVPGTGFNVTVPTPVSQQQWMLIQPAGTLAAGTITLPLNTQTPDGTEVLVTTTQIITSFSLALNGALAAPGAPTTLAANAFFRMRFVQSLNTWYRIG